ncbi:MAG: type II secretion system protein [bacterium]|nr:type II secretion system protein [bacterium]
MKKKGFTLVELMVVIAVIGILAGVALVSLNTSRAKARDVQRKTNIASVQRALEMAYADCGFYPYVDGVCAGTATMLAAGFPIETPVAPQTATDYYGSLIAWLVGSPATATSKYLNSAAGLGNAGTGWPEGTTLTLDHYYNPGALGVSYTLGTALESGPNFQVTNPK